MALAKKYRLKRKKDFLKIKQKGEILDTPLFGLLVLQEKTSFPLFGFVISRKISRKAVLRNKIRRRLTETVRLLLPRLKPNIKILVLAKKSLLQAKFQEIFQTMEKSLAELDWLN